MKVLKAFIFISLIFLFAAKGVSAYFVPPDQQIPNFENSVYKLKTQYNQDSSVKATGDKMIIWMAQLISGPMTAVGQTAVGYKSGAIYALSGLIAEMYKNPPASSTEYFADLGRNLGIVKPVYAQGVGFEGLRNLLPLWKASRNLAYIFFVIVFLYMGLAIMFRVKLDPKTVITIQNAIPKLVVALILVTFSYAIVGLMIDLIYLTIYLGIIALKEPLIAAGEIGDLQAKFTNLSFFQAIALVGGGGLQAIFGTGVVPIIGTIGVVLMGIVGAIVGVFVSPLALPLAIPLILLLILLASALFLVIKLFFSLVISYISIIISVIIAPVQIMLGVLPGSQGGFSTWFKNLLANILVFPAVALALLIGWLLTTTAGPSWAPPLVSVSGRTLSGIIGLGILLIANKIPEMIQTAFKIKPPGYGAAVGETISGGAGAISGLYGRTIGREVEYAKEFMVGEAMGKIDRTKPGVRPPKDWAERLAKFT